MATKWALGLMFDHEYALSGGLQNNRTLELERNPELIPTSSQKLGPNEMLHCYALLGLHRKRFDKCAGPILCLIRH